MRPSVVLRLQFLFSARECGITSVHSVRGSSSDDAYTNVRKT